MRIGIGAILGVLGGPSTYARELIAALAGVATQHEIVVLTDRPELVQPRSLRCVRVPLLRPWVQAFWDQWVPVAARRAGLDLYHGTKGTLPIWGPTPMVVTIHDLAAYHQPETFSVLQRWHQRALVPIAVRRARRIIADSEHARRDILAQFHPPPARVASVPLAVSDRFTPQPGAADAEIAARLQLPAQFILYAGTVQPRKRVDLLVRAFGELPRRDGVQLLIAGRLRPGYKPEFLQHLPPGARYLGSVSDDELALLYRKALAFCSPSSYEGFGLSVLEAMQSGCPVIAPRNTSLPEVGGEAPLWLSELSVAAIGDALALVTNDAAYRARMRELGLQRAQHFSWKDTALRTLAIYEEAVRG